MEAVLSQLASFGAPGTPGMQIHSAPGVSDMHPFQAGAMGNGGLGDDEKPINQAFNMATWPDGTHDQLFQGDLLFIARTKDTDAPNRQLIVPLHKFNEILRRGYALNFVPPPAGSVTDDASVITDADLVGIDKDRQLMYTRGSSRSDVGREMDALVPYMQELKKVGALPSMTQVYTHQARREGSIDTFLANDAEEVFHERSQRLGITLGGVADDVREEIESYRVPRHCLVLSEQYKNLLTLLFNNRNTHLRYTSVQGILEMWNFLGVYVTGSKGKTDYSGLAPTITVRVRGLGPVINLWEGTRPWSKLYCVLTRTPAGYFQVVPWLSNDDEMPPVSLMIHKDIMGHDARGHYWFLGHAEDDSRQKMDKSVKNRAAGVSGSSIVLLSEALKAKVTLDTLQVHLRI